mmetsp:Transcript_12197/g.40081  ORF Transcript_12197/g.40081 Transcript_12197/m.40081 type:complete len:300 (-) Transcript_12197:11-910(-)
MGRLGVHGTGGALDQVCRVADCDRAWGADLRQKFFRWTGAARVDVGAALLERPLLRDGLRQARAQPVADDHVDSSLLQQRARAPILAAFPPPRQRTSASARSVCRAIRVARCRHCEHQLCARRWYLFYRIRLAKSGDCDDVHSARRNEQGFDRPHVVPPDYGRRHLYGRGGAVCVHRRGHDVRAGTPTSFRLKNDGPALGAFRHRCGCRGAGGNGSNAGRGQMTRSRAPCILSCALSLGFWKSALLDSWRPPGLRPWPWSAVELLSLVEESEEGRATSSTCTWTGVYRVACSRSRRSCT